MSLYCCWCFYTLGLFSVMSRTIDFYTFQPCDCLKIASLLGDKAFTQLSAAAVAALVKLE